MDRKAWSAKTHGRTSFCPPCRYFSLRFLRLTSLDGRLLDSKKTLEEESIEDGDSISAIVQTPRSLWLLKMFEAFLWISRNMWRQLQWVHSGHTAWNSKCNIHMTGHRQEPCFVASLYAKTGKVGPSLLLSYSCILDLPSSFFAQQLHTNKETQCHCFMGVFLKIMDHQKWIPRIRKQAETSSAICSLWYQPQVMP